MTDFAELGVSESRVALLKAMGIITPTPVQEETIPIVARGRDVISQAQTGTGKTLAFVLPMLDKIDTSLPYIQGLIVTPTRELAIQITAEIKKLLDPRGEIKVLAVYGGQDVEAQLHKLKGNIHIVIATPGRLLDHMRRETISLGGVSMLVLDEADQMLHMGFLKEVEEILKHTPYKKQAMLFSATMPPSIREMAGRILRNPEHVTVKSERITVKDIRQWAVETTDREKQATLVKLLEVTQPYLSIIFCRTKTRAKTLNEALQEMGFASDELHGDLSQAKREKVMKQFRDAKLQLLIATDVAARGLDVEGVTHVFNYDIPHDVESYIHRIGRTGRAGESGLAITLFAAKDRRELADIENGIEMYLERRSEEGKALGGGGLEHSRTGGGFGREGGGAGRTRGNAGAGKGRSSSGSKARGGDKSYGAGAGGGGRGDRNRGAAAKPGTGNRSSAGEWQNRGQSRDAAAKGKPVRGSASAPVDSSDEAIGFSFSSERGDRDGRSSGRGGAAGRKPVGFGGRSSGGAGKRFGGSSAGRPGRGGAGTGGRRSSPDERGAERATEERAGRPSRGGTTRRNSDERFAERAAAAARAESKPGERGGFGRSSSGGGGGAKPGRKPEQRGGSSFGGGGRSSGPRSGGGPGGFKGGSKGPSGSNRGGGGGGRGSSRGR
ncbi:DEAD/DEAH box helicase [Cohnella sp.]|uniref:DEAD/DEAH box helicase n=1 Tax=Cohnella sp. TaxID=1883426 RepID=UPI00356B2D43